MLPMHPSHRGRHRRWRLAFTGMALASLLMLAACASGTTSGPISHQQGVGQIVVQVFRQPGFTFPEIAVVPAWTLYGDGTLVYAGGPIGGPTQQLMTATLSDQEVGAVLNVLINQDHFFDSTQSQYGQPTPDVGATLLTVNANGQSKTVSLLSDPGSEGDQQTRNLFAALTYLFAYQPAQPTTYTAPGVALLAYNRVLASALDGPEPTLWPYADVDLAQAYTLSCSLVEKNGACPQTSGGGAFLGVYSARARDVLTLVGAGLPARQGAYVYRVLAYPLLPDALVAQNGQTPGVLVNGTHRVPLQPAPLPSK